jgi:hypothetical protein
MIQVSISQSFLHQQRLCITNSRIAAFATSLSKILSTKLSSTRREDPLLSRSADAQKAAKEIVDSALDAKVRKQARQQKLIALEKGRVRDVLVATTNELTGDLEASTASILEQEKRLRKVVSTIIPHIPSFHIL